MGTNSEGRIHGRFRSFCWSMPRTSVKGETDPVTSLSREARRGIGESAVDMMTGKHGSTQAKSNIIK